MKPRILIITAIILCILLPFSSFAASAQTAGNTSIGVITAAPETITSYDAVNDPDYLTYQSFLQDNSGIVSFLYNKIYAMETEIDVSDYHLSIKDMRILMDIMSLSFPELFYMNGYRYGHWGDTVAYIMPNYTVSDAEEKRQQFFEIAEKRYLPLVDDSMDDFTKAVILHDELALNSYYAFPEQTRLANNYTYMAEGWGVCQQYTECYAYLLAQCGIKSEIVQSDAMGHAWIKAEIDGSYYNIDLTWDDPTPDKVGKVRHNYFLFSDSVFRTEDTQTNRSSHHGYLTIHPSDNTKYDRFDNLHSFTTQLCYLNGAFYAITSDGKLVRYDHHTDEITVLSSLDFKWSAGGNSYWIGNFSSLVPFDEKLYYNSPDKVYQYDPESNTTNLFAENTEDDKIYGLKVVDNQLWAVCTDNPNIGYAAPVYLSDLPIPTYDIVIDDAITGGSVTADLQSAEEGQTVTLTVTPDNGAEVIAVTVNRVLIIPNDGVYSFEMPAADVTVSAVFEKDEEVLYGDVDDDGEVTIMDATAIQRALANLPNSGYNKAAADVDDDGDVTILDATVIQRWLAGLPTNSLIKE